MSLITVDQVKTFLEITSTQHDAKLQDCVDAAAADVETYCDRKFSLASYTPETTPDDALLDGKDLPFLYTPQWPIVSVTSLKLVQEGNNGDIQTFAANQYAVKKLEGMILLTTAANIQLFGQAGITRPTFPAGVQNIAVSYTAGFATLPKDLVQAIVMVAAQHHLIGNTRRLGAKSINMVGGQGGGTTSFAINGIPAEAREKLDRYKSVIPR
jgi:Phage gp6-like head-tail connector protein